MADNIPAIIDAEPEERIESALVAILAEVCTIPVEGALTPATEGTVKGVSTDTFISVSVDQASQNGDYAGRPPMTYSARVSVHCALADDPNAELFRDECRRVRAVLASLTGDGCLGLSAARFRCDAFILDSTSTTFESGENPTNSKTYTATLTGRTLTTES